MGRVALFFLHQSFRCVVASLDRSTTYPTIIQNKNATTQVWKAFDTSEGVEVAWNTLCLDEVPRADKKRILNEIKILEKVREYL